MLRTRADANVLVVEARLTLNFTNETIEQVVAKMQSSHLQLLQQLQENILCAPAALPTALGGRPDG